MNDPLRRAMQITVNLNELAMDMAQRIRTLESANDIQERRILSLLAEREEAKIILAAIPEHCEIESVEQVPSSTGVDGSSPPRVIIHLK